MKKFKIIFYKKGLDKTSMFLYKGDKSIKEYSLIESNPLIQTEKELISLGWEISDIKIGYIGTLLSTLILTVDCTNLSNDHMSPFDEIDIISFLEDTALTNLTDHSTVALFLLNSSKIIKI